MYWFTVLAIIVLASLTVAPIAVWSIRRSSRPQPEISVQEAAQLFASEYVSLEHHVFAASLGVRRFVIPVIYPPQLRIIALVDHEGKKHVPKWYRGHRVYVRKVSGPAVFASRGWLSRILGRA